MTAPMSPSPARVGDDRAGGATTPASTFDAEMRAALAAGEPLLDNVTDGTADGPGACTCPVLPHEHTEDACAAQLWEQTR